VKDWATGENIKNLFKLNIMTDLEKPTMEKYGWQSSNSFEEESGWMFEGGEDAYYEALEKWEQLKP